MLEKLFFKDPNELTLVINGTEIVVTSARLLRSMDTCADALTAVMPWYPDFTMPGYNPAVNSATNPYGYQTAGVYLGGELHMVGVLYNVTHRKGQDGWTKDLEIFSQTADIIDSTVVQPYEASLISLRARCEQQCTPFGINVLVGDGVNLLKKKRISVAQYGPNITFVNALNDDALLFTPSFGLKEVVAVDPTYYRKPLSMIVEEEELFPRVSAKRTDTVFEHLKKLAAQRGCLLSCTKYGELLITKANISDIAVATITDDSANADVLDVKFSGRDRFQYYKAIAQSARSRASQKTSIAQDEAVTANRLLAFSAGDIIPGSATSAAEWRKNKSAAEALTFDLPVNTWYDDYGLLWEPNTKINIKSKIIGDDIFGFTFLITKVEFKYDENGSTAVLGLKPPTVYTSGAIEEPWRFGF